MNFDLKTLGSGEVGEGCRRGKKQQFFRHVRASHTLLGKLALFPHRPRIPESSRIDVRIRGELYFFQFIRYVLRFSNEIGKKQFEYSRHSSGFGLSAEFTTMYNNPINKLKNKSRIS